jgi:hypothetical protein
MQAWRNVLLVPVLGAAAFNVLACYTVYDRSGGVAYQSENQPVDMSRPLHEALSARFGTGAHMIFNEAQCQVVSSLASGSGARNVSTVSPLLMDERTARAMNLPHTMIGHGVALVQPRDAVVPPGVTVLATPRMAAATPARDTVITEWRGPAGTTVETVDRPQLADPTRMMGAGPSPRR